MDFTQAKRYAFRLLSMRNYHSAVLFRKLSQKGAEDEVCEKVIAECRRLGFIKDEEAILREFRRGYGPRYIEYKLRLSREEVRKIITRGMQREKIEELLPKLGEKQKALRALQRRGFDLDIAVEIFS